VTAGPARLARSVGRAGATPEAVAEALGVALLMGGGPSSVYAPKAWDAFWEFIRDPVAHAPTCCSESPQ
jgi:hypothetical protein